MSRGILKGKQRAALLFERNTSILAKACNME